MSNVLKTTTKEIIVIIAIVVVFVLVFSIVVVYLLGSLLKRNMFRSQSVLGAQGSFRIIGHLSLNPKQILYLVEVADRVLVISATETSISTLSEITDAEMAAGVKGAEVRWWARVDDGRGAIAPRLFPGCHP